MPLPAAAGRAGRRLAGLVSVLLLGAGLAGCAVPPRGARRHEDVLWNGVLRLDPSEMP